MGGLAEREKTIYATKHRTKGKARTGRAFLKSPSAMGAQRHEK